MFKVHIIFERLEGKSMTVEDCCVWGDFKDSRIQGFKVYVETSFAGVVKMKSRINQRKILC